jgi:uncharacterized protein
MATEVRDSPDRNRYEASVDGELAGFAHYRDVEGVRVFDHTEVFDAFEGKGVGSTLAGSALDDVRAHGGKLVALCPFISAYLERHAEYADLVDHDLGARLRAARGG